MRRELTRLLVVPGVPKEPWKRDAFGAQCLQEVAELNPENPTPFDCDLAYTKLCMAVECILTEPD